MILIAIISTISNCIIMRIIIRIINYLKIIESINGSGSLSTCMSTRVYYSWNYRMSKIFQRLYLNPLWGTEALPTLLTLRSSLSTTLPLSRRHLPKPQPPGLGYNRSELVYKQHKHYKEIFKSKEREGGGDWG